MTNRTYYGKLGVANLPSEVRSIWYSRDVELEPDSASWKWSWEHEDRPDERVERRDFLTKIIAVTPLNEQQLEVLKLYDLDHHTLESIAELWGVTRERVRQVREKALRLLRKHSSEITNIPSWEIDPEVTTWSWYRIQQITKRRRSAA